MQKKSMATVLVACLLTLALLSSSPFLGNLWTAVSVAASVCGGAREGIVAAAGAAWSTGVWIGISTVLTGGVGTAIAVGGLV